MIKKIFIKKQLFNFIIINILMLIIVTNVSFAAINPANNGSDMFNRSMWHGYFYNEQQAWGGDCAGRVLCQGLGSTDKPVNNKADFINQVKSYWSTGSNKGADFIILTMIGKKPASLNAPMQLSPTQEDVNKWEKLVNDSNIILNDIILDVRWNTYTQNLSNGRHDIAWYDQHTTGTRLTNQPAISFSDSSGKIFYSIRKDCGNPVNAMPGSTTSEGDPKGNLNTFSSVKIGDNNVVATEADSNQAYIDYKDLTNYISFRNYVKTSNLENVKGERLRFKVTTTSSNVSLSDSNFSWGAHPYNIGPSEGFVVNPNVIFNNNTGWQNTLADSNSRLKINNKVENLIGNKICRKVEVTSSPNWLNKLSTNSEACVTIKGDALNLNLDITDVEHEKGSGNKTVQFMLKKSVGSVFCSEVASKGAIIYIEAEKKLFDGSYESLGEKEIKNCEPITEDIIFGPDTLTNLDAKTIGDANNKISMRVKVKRYKSPSGVRVPLVREWSDPRVENISIYEAPFSIFAGNDVRACPADADKSRFVFKPLESDKGSSSRLASLWGTVTTLGSDNTNGWSKSLNTFNNDNKTKTKGISCDGAFSTGKTTNIEIGDRTNPENIEEGNVYINGSINVLAPSVYKINATNVYINKNVKYLKNVIINAQNIYTCAGDGTTGAIVKENWDNDCTNPLRIEGSINAKNLYLMRSVGTRRIADSASSQVGVGVTGYDRSDSIENRLKQPAEVIVYPAYFYFTNVGTSGAGSTKGSIDSYSQAAPRL